MAALRKSSARHVAPAALVLAALGVLGCKGRPKPPAEAAPAPSGSSAASAPAEPPARCHRIGNGPALRVGEVPRSSAEASPDDAEANEDDDQGALPFATRVDGALALDDAFAVGGLATQGKTTEAFVAWVPLGGGPGRRVGLGAVHGDVDPPLIAGLHGTLVVAVPDMDAGGGMLRLHRLEEASDKPTGDASLTGVEHDAGSALAMGEQGAVLVWGAKRGRDVGLKVLSLDPAAISGPFSPRELEGTLNAESPVLVARPGGFWLSWVSEQPASGAGRPDAGPPRDAGPSAAEGDGRLVDVGPRVLMALPLDGAGKPNGAPRAVSGARSHVVGFEAAPLPDGSLSLTWREEEAAPGVESAPPDLARVRLDGAVERAKLDDEDLSAGLPALLADRKPGGHVWVALESASGATRIGVLKESALALESLVGDRLLRAADVLAAGAGKLLVSRNRGRAVELEVLECKSGP